MGDVTPYTAEAWRARCLAAEAERDRMRAVVEAARRLDRARAMDPLCDEEVEAAAAVRRARGRDVSALRVDWAALAHAVGRPTLPCGAVGDVVYDGCGAEVAWIDGTTEAEAEATAIKLATLATLGHHLVMVARASEGLDRAASHDIGPCRQHQNAYGAYVRAPSEPCEECWISALSAEDHNRERSRWRDALDALAEAAGSLGMAYEEEPF